jgi:hypothetical protein
LQRRVLQALRCRRWFESEAPPWALPLPLSAEDCYGRWQGSSRNDQRPYLVGKYGLLLRGAAWEWKNVPSFEMHCAQMLAPPPEIYKRQYGARRSLAIASGCSSST